MRIGCQGRTGFYCLSSPSPQDCLHDNPIVDQRGKAVVSSGVFLQKRPGNEVSLLKRRIVSRVPMLNDEYLPELFDNNSDGVVLDCP